MNLYSQDKSSWPKISVILPNRNMGPALEKTIQSIIAQDYPNYELIIIDNCSKDNSLDVIKKYERHITYWVSESDGGIYDGYNKGIKVATGDWLYFIGAGDYLLEPDVFRSVMTNIDGVDIVYGNCYWGSHDRLHGGKYSKWRLINHNMCHQTIFYHRELFKKHGLYDTQYWIYADWVFNFKCWSDRHSKKKYVDKLIVFYDGRGASYVHHAKDSFMKERPSLIAKYFGVLHLCLYFIKTGYRYMQNNVMHIIKPIKSSLKI
ncbi:MAG: glycosyltransferase family 2 protein [Candidatus Omnitrophica bacterium]|nr:glycosyltransferase family 2 protein [Candidatus Omnitrophota bacterium]